MSQISDGLPRIKTSDSIVEALKKNEPILERVFWAHIIYDWETRDKKIQLLDDPLPTELSDWTRVYRVDITLPVPIEVDKTVEIKPIELKANVSHVDNEQVPSNENFAYTVGRRLYIIGGKCAPGEGTYESHWKSSIMGDKPGPCTFTVQKNGRRVRVTVEEY